MQNGEILLHIIEDYGKSMDKWGEIDDEESVIAICDYLLEGNLYIKSQIPEGLTYEEELKFEAKTFNWEILYSPAPNICQVFLQAFLPIKYLIQGYNISSNMEYLDLASELIKSWLEYEPNSNNRFTWYAHSSSDRVLRMVYFILTVKKNNITKYGELINEIHDSIKKHAEYLYGDANYISNNQGTLIDRALYTVSLYLDDGSAKKYREKAINRLMNAFKTNFSDEMVYLENSIHYHLYTLDLFFTIEKSLNHFGDSCGVDQSAIEKSVDFFIHYSKPDLSFPIIGDSIKNSLMNEFSFSPSVKQYPPLEWLLSSGKSGKPPKKLFKVYQNEGYAFFRNSWDVEGKNGITYTSFRSGFLKTSHKHADDLSFTLFDKGKDIFIDPGNSTFESGAYKDFFISALAHNTVVVDDETYPFLEGNNEDTNIIDYGNEDDYSFVIGKNDMYGGVNITRSLYYLKNGGLVIVDDVHSPDVHEYSQYFHLSSKINIGHVDTKFWDDNVLVRIFDDDVEVNLFQLGCCNVTIIDGNKNKARPGIVSELYYHLKETTSLKFSKNFDKTRFITLITVNDINEENNKQCYIESKNKGLIENLVIEEFGEEIKIPLKKYSRKISRYVQITQRSKTQFTFTHTETEDDETFAWYILRNGQKVDKIWYSPDPVLNYTFQESGKYEIKYFIKKGEKTKMYSLPKSITIPP